MRDGFQVVVNRRSGDLEVLAEIIDEVADVQQPIGSRLYEDKHDFGAPEITSPHAVFDGDLFDDVVECFPPVSAKQGGGARLGLQATPNPNFRRVVARVDDPVAADGTVLLTLSTVLGRY